MLLFIYHILFFIWNICNSNLLVLRLPHLKSKHAYFKHICLNFKGLCVHVLLHELFWHTKQTYTFLKISECYFFSRNLKYLILYFRFRQQYQGICPRSREDLIRVSALLSPSKEGQWHLEVMDHLILVRGMYRQVTCTR